MITVVCPSCGKNIKATARHCGYCGADVSSASDVVNAPAFSAGIVKVCAKCGKEYTSEAVRFCSKCGSVNFNVPGVEKKEEPDPFTPAFESEAEIAVPSSDTVFAPEDIAPVEDVAAEKTEIPEETVPVVASPVSEEPTPEPVAEEPVPSVETAPVTLPKKCVGCGAEYDKDVRFCSKCGSSEFAPAVVEIEPATVAEPIVEPIVEPIAEPIAEPISEPVAETPEPFVATVEDLAEPEIVPAPVVEEAVADIPVELPKKCTVCGTVYQKDVRFCGKCASSTFVHVEPEAEPETEPVVEPLIEPIPEPVIEAVPEAVSAPAAKVCASCGAVLPVGAKFCGKCGSSSFVESAPAPMPEPAPAAKVCASCGAVLPVGAKFCGKCGNSSVAASAPEPAPVPATKKCVSCGAELPADAKFCGKCGNASFTSASSSSTVGGGVSKGFRPAGNL